MLIRDTLIWLTLLTLCLPTRGSAAEFLVDEYFGGFFHDYVVVTRESGAAKEVRLKWISDERDRVHAELASLQKELGEIAKFMPRPLQPRVVPESVARQQELARKTFNIWAATNDPSRRVAILRGAGLNALLEVLGPIAHYRRLRTQEGRADAVLRSLAPGNRIEVADATHYRISPATLSGGNVTFRINRLPLDLVWSQLLLDSWPEDCASIQKSRDAFVSLLENGIDRKSQFEHAELLDKSLSLLQAKIQKRLPEIPGNRLSDAAANVQRHRDLKESLQYLETLCATVDCLKNDPNKYQVHRFLGGSIEDFLDFCYMRGMKFQRSQPGDDEHYYRLHTLMKDYAHDVQFVEDWRESIDQRIRSLDEEDRFLVWHAAVQ